MRLRSSSTRAARSSRWGMRSGSRPSSALRGPSTPSGTTSSDFYAPRPLVNAEVLKLDHPVFYGYTDKIMPIKYLGGPLMSVGAPDQAGVLARYVGGDEAVLSGLMKGASEIRQRPFAIDVPGGFTGKGRVVLFSNNPIYRWQNHGEFNMVFNTMLNWNDLAGSSARPATPPAASGGTTGSGDRSVVSRPSGGQNMVGHFEAL